MEFIFICFKTSACGLGTSQPEPIATRIGKGNLPKKLSGGVLKGKHPNQAVVLHNVEFSRPRQTIQKAEHSWKAGRARPNQHVTCFCHRALPHQWEDAHCFFAGTISSCRLSFCLRAGVHLGAFRQRERGGTAIPGMMRVPVSRICLNSQDAI